MTVGDGWSFPLFFDPVQLPHCGARWTIGKFSTEYTYQFLN
jgi:hypothetical protein